MGQNFMLLNLTRREHGGYGGKFGEDFHSHNALTKLLGKPTFPTKPPKNISELPAFLRSHLGLFARVPAELIDMVLEHLSLPNHIASFAAAHPAFVSQSFRHIMRIRSKAFNDITWYRTRVALVGDYLDHAQDVDGLLPDDLRADMEQLKQEPDPDFEDAQEVTLPSYASNYFRDVDSNFNFGPLSVLEDNELRLGSNEEVQVFQNRGSLSLQEWRAYHASEEFFRNNVDYRRISRLLSHAWPTLPSPETPVLCNVTKRQFVWAKALCSVRMGRQKCLTIGLTVIFLTVCSDCWSFAPPYDGNDEDSVRKEIRTVVGTWAGDCLAVVQPEDVEEGMVDVSGDVVKLVGWYLREAGFAD